MSGGGKSSRRGGMCTSNSKSPPAVNSQLYDDIPDGESTALEKILINTTKELEAIRSNRRVLVAEIKSLTKKIKCLTLKIPKIKMDITGCDTSREELTKRLPVLSEQIILSSADEQKCKTLKQHISKCKSDMASCAIVAAKLESEVVKQYYINFFPYGSSSLSLLSCLLFCIIPSFLFPIICNYRRRIYQTNRCKHFARKSIEDGGFDPSMCIISERMSNT